MVGPCIWLAYNSSREKECHPSRFPRPCSGRGPRRERFVWEWGLEFSIEVVTTNESCYVHIYIAYLERFNLVVEQLARFAHPARAAPCSAVLLALWTTICFFQSMWSGVVQREKCISIAVGKSLVVTMYRYYAITEKKTFDFLLGPPLATIGSIS